MLPLSRYTFALLLFLVGFCVAGDIVLVDFDDSRLITNPPSLWSSFDYTSSDCGRLRWLNTTDQSVTLIFLGTSLTVDFLSHACGALASVTIDGVIVDQVDTFSPGKLLPETCRESLSWTSPALPARTHTVTITMIIPGALDITESPISNRWLPIRGFAFVAPDDPWRYARPSYRLPLLSNIAPRATDQPSNTDNGAAPSKIAAIVLGGIVSITFIIMSITFIHRRNKMLRLARSMEGETLVPQTTIAFAMNQLDTQTKHEGEGSGPTESGTNGTEKEVNPPPSLTPLPPAQLSSAPSPSAPPAVTLAPRDVTPPPPDTGLAV